MERLRIALVLLSLSNPLFLVGDNVVVNSNPTLHPEPVFGASRDKAPTIADKTLRATTAEAYGHLPLSFESNHGQAAPEAKFIARGKGFDLLLGRNEALLSFGNDGAGGNPCAGDAKGRRFHPHKAKGALLRMKFANTSPRIEGINPLRGKTNYLTGNDSKNWRTNVPTYGAVKYKNVYSGIDVVFYGNRDHLEYDFIISPAADPRSINLTFDGAQSLRLDEEGNVVLQVETGDIIQQRPVVYQERDGVKQEIEGRYVLNGRCAVGFEVAKYDQTKPLIIDPILRYSTFLGGNNNEGFLGAAADSAGNLYLSGGTGSTDFPTTPGAFQRERVFDSEVVISKISADGSELIYSTYISGHGSESSTAIAVDPNGNAVFAGGTTSDDFPTTPGAFARSCGDNGSCTNSSSVFITKLNSTGSALIYSTFVFGTISGASVAGMAMDSSGDVYLTGYDGVQSFTAPRRPFPNSHQAVYVVKMNSDGSDMIYSTYIGTGDPQGIAVDESGNAYVAGITIANDFPTTEGAFQRNVSGSTEAFVTKLNSTGADLIYSTLLGGSNGDVATGMAIDKSRNAYVTGWTNSVDFPVTGGAVQTLKGGELDFFVTKLNDTGSALVYSTYLGGSQREQDPKIAVDDEGNAYIAGSTTSSDFPILDPIQRNCGSCVVGAISGLFDLSVTKLNSTGSQLIYSTFLGGDDDDRAFAITVDSSGNAYVVGAVLSRDVPLVNPIQRDHSFGRNYDNLIAKIHARGGPRITSASIVGKKLLIMGENFDSGAVILMDGQQQKTKHDDQDSSILTGKKVGKKIASGQTVRLQVRNSDGLISSEFSFSRP